MFLIIHKPTASVVFAFDDAHAGDAIAEFARIKEDATMDSHEGEYILLTIQGINGYCDELVTPYSDIKGYVIEPDEIALH